MSAVFICSWESSIFPGHSSGAPGPVAQDAQPWEAARGSHGQPAHLEEQC
jgi:hypothetical protein